MEDYKIMECPTCLCEYSLTSQNLNPKILSCGHTFCSSCISREFELHHYFKCPYDGIDISNIDIKLLPENSLIAEKAKERDYIYQLIRELKLDVIEEEKKMNEEYAKLLLREIEIQEENLARNKEHSKLLAKSGVILNLKEKKASLDEDSKEIVNQNEENALIQPPDIDSNNPVVELTKIPKNPGNDYGTDSDNKGSVNNIASNAEFINEIHLQEFKDHGIPLQGGLELFKEYLWNIHRFSTLSYFIILLPIVIKN